MRTTWAGLEGEIDLARFESVRMHLEIQEKEAKWWRDACLSYFQQFSGRPLPEGLEAPAHDLEYYRSLSYPYAPGIRPRW
jgi:alpha-glucuronidase